MTTAQFIKAAQGYYGEYRPAVRKLVEEWLERRSGRMRELIWAEVLKSFSNRWGKPPAVAELEDAYSVAAERRAEERRDSQVEPMTGNLLTSETEEEYCSEEEADRYFAELRKRMSGIQRKWREAKGEEA